MMVSQSVKLLIVQLWVPHQVKIPEVWQYFIEKLSNVILMEFIGYN